MHLRRVNLIGGLTAEKGHAVRTGMLQGEGEMILLVDDEALFTKVISTLLKKNGYQVLTAAEGNEALALYANHVLEIKVVITDVLMPGMDGINLTRALKQINPQVKIIASTGQAPEACQAELLELGVKVILNKPYEMKKLLAALYDINHVERAK